MAEQQGLMLNSQAAEEEGRGNGNRDPEHSTIAIKPGDEGRCTGDQHNNQGTHTHLDQKKRTDLRASDLALLDGASAKAQVLEHVDEGSQRGDHADESRVL